jgi:hypothetical protein
MAQLPILMRRTPTGLAPASPLDSEELDRISQGATVEVTVRQRRSNPHHRFFFATMSRLVQSGAVPFSSTEELVDALKVSCGVTKLQQSVGGAPYILPGSISYAAKDEPAFREFREKAFALIAQHYGVDCATVLPPREMAE